MKFKMKRALLGLLALAVSSVALAQTTLAPYITGTNSEHRREVFEVGFLRFPQVNNALTALAGGAQAGTQLTLGYNRFTVVATAGDSAQLPVLTGSVMVMVTNSDSADSMNVFPPTGGTINALSANTAFAVAANKTVIFIQAADGVWYTILTA